jgi:hypothetical protein
MNEMKEVEVKAGDRLYQKNALGYYYVYTVIRTTKMFVFVKRDAGGEDKISKRDINTWRYKLLTPEAEKDIKLWRMQCKFRNHLECLRTCYEKLPLKTMLEIIDISKEFVEKKDATPT